MQRREWLKSLLFGAGALGLRSAFSGIPAYVLADPARALAAFSGRRALDAAGTAQYLILSASDSGEPMNCNVPGMYADPNFRHPSAPTMAPTTFALGPQTVTGAQVWSTLPANVLSRSCFFHHSTYTIQHGGLSTVYNLVGAVPNEEFIISAMAPLLQVALGTIQTQPISISGDGGSEAVSFQGVQQPVFSPTSIRNLLTTPAALAAINQGQALRDQALAQINALTKQTGTTAQRNLVDSWANSQTQARSLSQAVMAQLSSISDNTPASQVKAAALLCQLKLAPVVVVHIPFGSDNHVDTDPDQAGGTGLLPTEEAQHLSGVAAISTLMSTLASAQMQDNVTFATLTTFGRGNAPPNLSGRPHNDLHTANLMIGKNVAGSLVGGATLIGNPTGANSAPLATAIDSHTGMGDAGGDIAYRQTLAAYGATLAAACGLDTSDIATIVPSGTVVKAALA